VYKYCEGKVKSTHPTESETEREIIHGEGNVWFFIESFASWLYGHCLFKIVYSTRLETRTKESGMMANISL